MLSERAQRGLLIFLPCLSLFPIKARPRKPRSGARFVKIQAQQHSTKAILICPAGPTCIRGGTTGLKSPHGAWLTRWSSCSQLSSTAKRREVQQDGGSSLCSSFWPRKGEEEEEGEAAQLAVPSHQSSSRSRTRTQLAPEMILALREGLTILYGCIHSFSRISTSLMITVPGRALLTELEDVSQARPWQQEGRDVGRRLTA